MMHTRYPYAREALHSTRVYDEECALACAWCGSHRQTRAGRAWLYRFRVETDDGRTYTDARLFCSRECRTSYCE